MLAKLVEYFFRKEANLDIEVATANLVAHYPLGYYDISYTLKDYPSFSLSVLIDKENYQEFNKGDDVNVIG